MVVRAASRSSAKNLRYQYPPLFKVLSVFFLASASALAMRMAEPTLVSHRSTQIRYQSWSLRASACNDWDTRDRPTRLHSECTGRSRFGVRVRKARTTHKRSDGKSWRLVTGTYGGAHGAGLVLLMRFFLRTGECRWTRYVEGGSRRWSGTTWWWCGRNIRRCLVGERYR